MKEVVVLLFPPTRSIAGTVAVVITTVKPRPNSAPVVATVNLAGLCLTKNNLFRPMWMEAMIISWSPLIGYTGQPPVSQTPPALLPGRRNYQLARLVLRIKPALAMSAVSVKMIKIS